MKKQLKDLNLLDRFLFAEAIEDPEVMELMLEIILGREISLKEPQAEKELRGHIDGKNVRLDVLGEDDEGNLYNAEVQKINTGSLLKRSRYYHSMIDHRMLDAGNVNYNELKESYVIMIAPFDLFGKGLFRYDFSMTCHQHPELKLEDGARRIFLNTHGITETGVSNELIELLQYIEHSNDATAHNCSSQRVKQIHHKVNAIKDSEEVGIRFMNAWEEKVYEKQEAREEMAIEIALKMKTMGLSDEQIKEATGLSDLKLKEL